MSFNYITVTLLRSSIILFTLSEFNFSDFITHQSFQKDSVLKFPENTPMELMLMPNKLISNTKGDF